MDVPLNLQVGIPLNPLAKGMNSTSLRASVNAHCYACMGGQIGDLRTKKEVVDLIRNCESSVCPLHNIRPFTSSKSGVNDGKTSN